VVRRGNVERLRSVLSNDTQFFPRPGCTTITVYPHNAGQSRLIRWLFERLTF